MTLYVWILRGNININFIFKCLKSYKNIYTHLHIIIIPQPFFAMYTYANYTNHMTRVFIRTSIL